MPERGLGVRKCSGLVVNVSKQKTDDVDRECKTNSHCNVDCNVLIIKQITKRKKKSKINLHKRTKS